MERTKGVAYADDLLVETKGDSVRAVENYANVERGKIDGWSKKTRSNSTTRNPK